MTADPFAAIADIILGIYHERKVQQWISLLFQMGFSAIVTFLFECGTLLTTTKSWTISVGGGMVMSAVVLTIFFRSSPLTKGMLGVLPSAEAQKEIDSSIQRIQRASK